MVFSSLMNACSSAGRCILFGMLVFSCCVARTDERQDTDAASPDAIDRLGDVLEKLDRITERLNGLPNGERPFFEQGMDRGARRPGMRRHEGFEGEGDRRGPDMEWTEDPSQRQWREERGRDVRAMEDHPHDMPQHGHPPHHGFPMDQQVMELMERHRGETHAHLEEMKHRIDHLEERLIELAETIEEYVIQYKGVAEEFDGVKEKN